MKRAPLLVAFAVVAVAGAALAWWLQRPMTAAATVVRAAPLVQTLQFSGRVATLSRVEVGSTLTGRVVEVAVAEGAKVRQGALLLRLESDELRAALAQAQASERQAQARLAGLRDSGRSGAQAGVEQAASVLRAAQADLKRQQELVAQGFVSEARLDDARRALGVAQAQADAAQAQRAAIAEQGSDIAQAQAQLALARSATQAAAARLAQAQVLAPADATVLARLVEPGQIVQPGRALLRLALAGPLQLVAQVDERYLGQIRTGQPAGVRADAFPQQRFDAKVLSIAPLVDAQRGAVEVKFELPKEAPAFLREDMTLSIEVETARRERTLAVPAAALREATDGDGRATVWAVRDGRVEARPVRVGLRTLDAAELLEGVQEGDVVLFGAAAPRPGARVRPDTGAPWPAPGTHGGTREDAGSAVMNAMGR